MYTTYMIVSSVFVEEGEDELINRPHRGNNCINMIDRHLRHKSLSEKAKNALQFRLIQFNFLK